MSVGIVGDRDNNLDDHEKRGVTTRVFSNQRVQRRGAIVLSREGLVRLGLHCKQGCRPCRITLTRFLCSRRHILVDVASLPIDR